MATTLKQDVLAAQAKAATIGVDGTVTQAFSNLLVAIDGYSSNLQNNAYIASPPNVQAILDQIKAIG